MIVKVDVLIPPPKEPGAPPTNIKKMNMISIGVPTKEISTVLNPAVLVIEWKKEVINWAEMFMLFRLFFCSKK